MSLCLNVPLGAAIMFIHTVFGGVVGIFVQAQLYFKYTTRFVAVVSAPEPFERPIRALTR